MLLKMDKIQPLVESGLVSVNECGGQLCIKVNQPRRKRSLNESVAGNIRTIPNTNNVCTNTTINNNRLLDREQSQSAVSDIATDSNISSTSTNIANKRRRLNQDQSENKHSDISECQTLQEDVTSIQESKQSDQSIFNGKDPYDLTAKELKELCRNQGLKVGGNKSVLINRLQNPTDADISPYAFTQYKSERTSQKQVHTMLRNAGIEDPEKLNKCLKKGIQRGFFVIDGPDSLDKVILRGQRVTCKRNFEVMIRDVLYQQSRAWDYDRKNNGGAVRCDCGHEECWNLYVTRLCEGYASLSSGKTHNHCEECPGFGKCIGDIRAKHCSECGKHWMKGLILQFPCACGSNSNIRHITDGATNVSFGSVSI